ncbi:MAG TPA: hypothetical protein VGA02_12320 [Gemmatimonadales bacterium]
MLSSPGRLTAFAVEERRIWIAYARRAARGTSHSWFSPGHVFQVQDRERQVLRLVHLQRITLAPPLVRTVARRSWLAAYLLARIPFLRTHYLGVIRKGTA